MQYDTPKNIYNTPAALFVAGFTGSPAMNLVPCTLADGQVVLGNCRFVLPPALALAGAKAKDLRFGIRPENVALDAGDGRVPVSAKVALTEPLGAETLVTLSVGNCELVARCPASFELNPGEPLTVYLSLSHMHLFDADSGLALVS
jgi:multiple sugar transport system ATP-binding protein